MGVRKFCFSRKSNTWPNFIRAEVKVGIQNTKTRFEDDPNRSYRFRVTSVQSYYGRNFQVALRELMSSANDYKYLDE